jgi:rod shape-determining protein MreB
LLNWLRRGRSPSAPDLLLDLGSWQVRSWSQGQLAQRASLVLWDLSSNQAGPSGDEAYQRLGRLPSRWSAARPFESGVVGDYEAALVFLRPWLEVHPAVAWAAPVQASEIELQAGCDVLRQAGASAVTLIPSTLAVLPGRSALDSEGQAILMLGHDLAQLSVYARGGSLFHCQRHQAGASLQHSLAQYILQRHALQVGRHQLEQCLCQLSLDGPETLLVRGKDLSSGLPRQLQLSQREGWNCLEFSLATWLEMLRQMLLELPPPAVSSVLSRGLLLAGGLAALGGISEWLSQELEMPVEVCPQPHLAVISGLCNWKDELPNLDWSRLL